MDAGNVGAGAADDVDEGDVTDAAFEVALADETAGVEEEKDPAEGPVITDVDVEEDAAADGRREYLLDFVCVCVGIELVEVEL